MSSVYHNFLLATILFALSICLASVCCERSDRYIYSMGLGKRYGGPYSFGLGKRPDRNIYGFGLGKRSSGAADFEAPYDADYFTEEEKRAARPYSFGIGKRGGNSLYSFGLGKRDTSIEENRVPVASVVEGKPVVAVATGQHH